MKKIMMATAALLCVGSAAHGEAPNLYPNEVYTADYVPAPGETAFDFQLKGYVLGLRIMKARFKGHMSDTDYTAYTDLKTSGIASVLKKLRIWAVTEGRYDQSGLYPETHTQQNLNKKNRRVEMRYDYGAETVSVDIHPPLGSQGVPPASPEERFSADEVLSGLLNIMMRDHRTAAEFCTGKVRVFDSKQHYNLRMVKAGTKTLSYRDQKVDAQGCHIYYEPINGFDPEDLPSEEEAQAPIKAYFANDEEAGLWVPLRFKYNISGFGASIKLKKVNIRRG